jgi:hypothetical protein
MADVIQLLVNGIWTDHVTFYHVTRRRMSGELFFNFLFEVIKTPVNETLSARKMNVARTKK